MSPINIKNLTRNTQLTNSAQMAISFIDRSLGLINPQNSRSMIFKTHFGIHTFFMSHPIDVLILDDQYHVKKICQDLPANRFFFYLPKYSIVIELPAGTIQNSHTRLNDKIEFE